MNIKDTVTFSLYSSDLFNTHNIEHNYFCTGFYVFTAD